MSSFLEQHEVESPGEVEDRFLDYRKESFDVENLFVFGLDLSVSKTGIIGGPVQSIIDDNDEYGGTLISTLVTTKPTVDFDHEVDLIRRISFITNTIGRYARDAIEWGYTPLFFIEGYAMGVSGNKGRIFDLAELGGAVKIFLMSNNYPFYIVTPGELKKFITGKGNSPKSDMRMAVYKKYKLDIDEDNMCDAYSLARVGFALFGLDPKATKSQIAALKLIKEKYHV